MVAIGRHRNAGLGKRNLFVYRTGHLLYRVSRQYFVEAKMYGKLALRTAGSSDARDATARL